MSLAVVVIASEKRRDVTLNAVLQSTPWMPHPEVDVVVVGDWEPIPMNARYYRVAPITHTTIDALIKRDVGWAATTADAVLFLCDDHKLAPGFLEVYRDRYEGCEWDMLAPARYTVRGDMTIPLNVGRNEGYIGGHAGIYRRRCAQLLPWSAGPHHLNWDLLHTKHLVSLGASLQYADNDLSVIDIEPGATPWV